MVKGGRHERFKYKAKNHRSGDLSFRFFNGLVGTYSLLGPDGPKSGPNGPKSGPDGPRSGRDDSGCIIRDHFLLTGFLSSDESTIPGVCTLVTTMKKKTLPVLQGGMHPT